ncbi:BLUF domain-containing protein [Lacinutrix sp. Hel_I_90]|uniref:BLUF domain-containing protein n=1 Tax=Lacinutrix sp. Hel_I_90 TaxID=1249999 RepID=UPI0006985D0B|nr:BLUF domain-containing protein [Lacinutrix sp. Hel_I_90]
MLKAICYISTIKSKTSQEDLDNLSYFVSSKNNELDITGILIIQQGHFFQIMEGVQTKVETIFDKIKKDSRHSGLIKLLETKIDYRIFEDYESGNFSVIKDFSNLKKLRIYFNWIKEANILEVDELITLTNTFLNYNQRL